MAGAAQDAAFARGRVKDLRRPPDLPRVQIHFNDAYELLTSGSDELRSLLKNGGVLLSSPKKSLSALVFRFQLNQGMRAEPKKWHKSMFFPEGTGRQGVFQQTP